ncbi:MAG: hypothetical protein ACOC6Q_02650 [Patescibacteria group bacterium]
MTIAEDINELTRRIMCVDYCGEVMLSMGELERQGVLGRDGSLHDVRVGPCCCGAVHTEENPAPVDSGSEP